MRNRILLLLRVILMVLISQVVFSAEKRRVAGMLTYVRGTVEVKRADSEPWLPAKTGMYLSEGDAVRTKKNSSAAITFTSGTRIKISQSTEFEIEIQPRIEKVASRIKMRIGKLWTQVRARTKFEVKTPIAVAAVRGTEFAADLNNQQLLLTVISGIVEVENDLGKVAVSPGQKTTVVAGKPPAEPVMATPQDMPTWQEEIVVPRHLRIKVKTPDGDADILFGLDKK